MPISILIEQIGPGATLQANGRDGYMHQGVPPGGPLVPELHEAANASLGNDATDAVLEIPLSPALIRAGCETFISINGDPRRIAPGESVRVASDREAVTYLAVPGGFDVPAVLGSRGTLLVAGMGGLAGRMIQRGDVLGSRLDAPASAPCKVESQLDSEGPIRVTLGPDLFPSSAIERLFTTTFQISPVMNRVGQRLAGGTLLEHADRVGSMPMVRGAIQITLDGTPIVLGPDHPTTGGYPVIATVVTADLGKLARRRPGADVRFAAT